MATKKQANTDFTLGIGASGMYGIGNQTGTQILPQVQSGLASLDKARTGSNQTKPATGTTGNAGTTAAKVAGKIPTDEPYKSALAATSPRATGTGTGTGAGTTVDPAAAEYAQRIAESYARTQPGNAPQWADQWAPQIEALQGQRYGPYDSKYLPQIDGLLDRILNRGEFQYNWSDDPLYRQYAARYQQQARQGMQDTMGQAAALTGGYGSSYATAAGNQAYAQQMQGLNDRAMDLYQLAKDRWDSAGTEMRSNLAALENREASNRAYYQDDRDTFYNRNDADIANLRDSQAMGWAAYQDAADREMAERQMAWDQYQYWNNLYESLRGKGGSGGGGKSTGTSPLTGIYAAALARMQPEETEEEQKRRVRGLGPTRNNRVQMQE